MDVLERLRAALEGRYDVEAELGHGGMAVVFRARDLKHGRAVAIKVLRPEVAVALGRDRFLHEIEIAAGLSHPNILALHDSGEADGLLYFVMPLLDGESLEDRIARVGPMPVEEVLRITTEVADALTYAHTQGLIHRDVKPGNVLFQAGHAVVCDLGIALATRDSVDRLTRTGFSVGTLRYMSPEQTEDGEVDGRADVYALGCMFYEMLTGDAPFDGVRMESILARKLTGQVPLLRERRPELPPTWQAVLERVLAVRPEDRFPTADAFVEALQASMTRTAIVHEEQRLKRARHLRGLGWAGGVAALVALGFWWSGSDGGPAMQALAVLPDTDGELDEAGILVRGVAEDLTSELARAGLRVKDTRAVNRFIGSGADNDEIAVALGVDGIVTMAATRARGTVETRVTLVDPVTDDIVWIEDFQAEERQILSLVSEMALSLADAIAWPLEDETRRRLATAAPEVDPEVRDALQRARFTWQSLTEDGFALATGYYRRALEASDSLSADAWAGLGSLYYMRSQQGLVSAAVARDSAAPYLARARELDPDNQTLAVTEAVEKTWVEWDWEAAEAAFEAALEANPRDAEMRAYHAQLLLYVGRDEEAAREEELAFEADPLSPLVQGLRAQNLNARGLYDEAEATLLEAIGRGSGLPYLLSTLRTTYHLMGRTDEALEIWRQSLTPGGAYTVDGDPEALEALDRGYAEGGYSAALVAVAELNSRRGGSAWGIGTLYTRAGRHEEALDWLERAVEAGNQNSPSLAVDRIFDPLRDEPRFQALVDRLGLPR